MDDVAVQLELRGEHFDAEAATSRPSRVIEVLQVILEVTPSDVKSDVRVVGGLLRADVAFEPIVARVRVRVRRGVCGVLQRQVAMLLQASFERAF